MVASVLLTERPVPDRDGHEFLWRGEVSGILRWADGTGDVAAGWWLEPTTGESSLVWRSAGDADRARDQIEHEPAACWFAQAMLASAIADALGAGRRRT